MAKFMWRQPWYFYHIPHLFAQRHPSYAREKNKTADSMVIGTHVLSFFVDVAVAKRHNFSCIVPMSAQLNEPHCKKVDSP